MTHDTELIDLIDLIASYQNLNTSLMKQLEFSDAQINILLHCLDAAMPCLDDTTKQRIKDILSEV